MKLFRVKNPRLRTLRGARKRVHDYEMQGYEAKYERIKLDNGATGYKVMARKMLKVGDKNLTIYGKVL